MGVWGYRAYIMLPRSDAVTISQASLIQSISLSAGRDDWSSSLISTMRLWRDEMLFILPKNINIRSATEEA